MAKSRSLGIISSLKEVSLDKASKILASVASKSPISKITKALGKDAKLHIVGGTVRDILLGQKQYDLDLATILHAEEVLRLLESSNIRVIETGITHGTVTAVIEGIPVEITTFRQPSAREDSRFSQTIEEDLNGRDFTINAIAFEIANNKIVDPLKGIEDLKNNLLRSVGSAKERFIEDPLRILRMIRFGYAAGREVETTTSGAAKELASRLEKVSIERIRSEFEKILVSSYPANAIRAMAELQLLQYVLPELIESIGFEQNEFHTQDVFEHTLTVVENAPPDLRLRLAALFHDIGKPRSLTVGEDGERHFYSHETIGHEMTKTAMRRLRFSNDEIHAVSELVRLHMRPMDCGPAGVRRLIRDLGPYFDDWKKLKTADAPPIMEKLEYDERLQNFEALVESEKKRLSKIGKRMICITGDDLIGLGFKSGPTMGKILKELENQVIENPEINQRETLLKLAENLRNSLT